MARNSKRKHRTSYREKRGRNTSAISKPKKKGSSASGARWESDDRDSWKSTATTRNTPCTCCGSAYKVLNYSELVELVYLCRNLNVEESVLSVKVRSHCPRCLIKWAISKVSSKTSYPLHLLRRLLTEDE